MIEDQEQDWQSDEDYIRDFALTGGFELRMTIRSRWFEATSSVSIILRKGESVQLSLSSHASLSLLLWNH